jgi:hypothetical protein
MSGIDEKAFKATWDYSATHESATLRAIIEFYESARTASPDNAGRIVKLLRECELALYYEEEDVVMPDSKVAERPYHDLRLRIKATIEALNASSEDGES